MSDRQPFPKALAARIRAANEVAERERRFDEYRCERAEARACGHEFPSFSEWLGETSAKERAEVQIETLARLKAELEVAE